MVAGLVLGGGLGGGGGGLPEGGGDADRGGRGRFVEERYYVDGLVLWWGVGVGWVSFVGL